MNRIAVALALVLFCPAALFAEPASKPRGEPENAWRYKHYNGRWWYWMPDDQWAFFNGRQWVTFSPESIGSSLANRPGQADGSQRGKEPPFSSSLGANTRSILDSTRPQAPLGASTSPGGVLGRGIGTNAPPIAVETNPSRPTRSGDAGSGVGGGSVGGTSVTGSAR